LRPFPYAVRLAGCRSRAWERGEEGQIGILILGLFSIVLVLILGAIDVTAAQLARMRLLDAADAAALDAADALDERAAY
jgi:Flp pilus assembly protein TadG